MSDRPINRGLAVVLTLVVFVLGTIGIRYYVALPFESMPARMHPASFAALFAGFVGAAIVWRAGTLRRIVGLVSVVLALLAVDVFVYSADTIATLRVSTDPRTWALALLGATVISQKVLAGLGSLFAGAAVGGIDRRMADWMVAGTATTGFVIAVMQMLYKAGLDWPVLLALKAFDSETNPVHSVWSRATGLNTSPNAFGAMAVICVAVALATMRGSWLRPITVLAGVGSLLLSQSRGGMVALLGVVIVYAILEGRAVIVDSARRRADAVILICGAAVIAGVLMFPGVSANLTARISAALKPATQSVSNELGKGGRPAKWRVSGEIIRKAPLGTHVSAVKIIRTSADSEYLTRALRSGPVMLLAFLAFLWWLVRLRPDGERSLGPLVAVAMAAMALTMDLTGTPLFYSVVMFVVGSRIKPTAESTGALDGSRNRRPAGVRIAVVGVVVVLTLIPLVWPYRVVTDMEAYDDRIQAVRGAVLDYREALGEQVRLQVAGPIDVPATDAARRFLEVEEPPVDRFRWRDSLTVTIDECEAAAQDVAAGRWQDAAQHLVAADASDALFTLHD